MEAEEVELKVEEVELKAEEVESRAELQVELEVEFQIVMQSYFFVEDLCFQFQRHAAWSLVAVVVFHRLLWALFVKFLYSFQKLRMDLSLMLVTMDLK